MIELFLFLLQLEFLPSMVAGVWTDESHLQLEATTQFRKLLSIGEYLGFIRDIIHSVYYFLIKNLRFCNIYCCLAEIRTLSAN